MGTGLVIRSLQSDIADQERIIAADEAILEHENDAEKRKILLDELFKAEETREKLKRKLQHYEFGG